MKNQTGRGGGVLGRRDHERVLYWKDADAYSEYARAFTPAGDDLFIVYTNYVQSMSRDIGLVRVLGPKPEEGITLIEQLTRKAFGVKADELRARARTGIGRQRARNLAARAVSTEPIGGIRNTFDVIAGFSEIAERHFAAQLGATARNLTISASLGSSFFSAITDVTFSSIAALMSGVPVSKVLARHLKVFATGGKADKMTALRSGYITGIWTSVAGSQSRFTGEVLGPKWLSDRTLRAAMLTPWTEAGRVSFGLEFAGYLTGLRGVAFRDLPTATRRVFTAHDINPAEWNLYRETDVWIDPGTGAEFIRPQDVARGAGPAELELLSAAEKVSHKFQSMVLIETDFAIPTTTARVRSLLGGARRPGTFWGEMLRAGSLFKSFPVTMMHTNLRRMWYADMGTGALGKAHKAVLFAHLGISATVMGMLGEQMFQISRGKDPKSMDPTTSEGLAAWGDAVWRGGALGWLGDMMFADQNRLGLGAIETLSGPVFSVGGKALRLTVGNVQAAIKGDKTDLGADLARFLHNITPGRSLWYTALAHERLWQDIIAKSIDPEANRRAADLIKRTRRQTGQEFFAPPNQLLPTRAPRLGAAIE
jgi:hypothetical protein